MKTLTVIIPDHVDNLISAEATRRNLNAVALCSGILADHFLGQSGATLVVPEEGKRSPASLPGRSETSDAFNVGQQFPDYPRKSVELAQRIVDEALRIPNTRAFRSEGANGSVGVGFDPNFVFIQYLQKKDPGGIMVSFYGPPSSHGIVMKRGQGNYSRIKIETVGQLPMIIPEIQLSYRLKFKRRSR